VTTPAVMLDTNVVSELMRHEPHPGVARFVGFLPSPLLSVAVLHELVEPKPMDALIAASALCRSASLATRNLKHFVGLRIGLVNPWTA
jgi:predicted nucleic acid-binding protein